MDYSSQPNATRAPLNFELKNTEKVECSVCGNTTFGNGVIFRKVSKLISGTDKDGLVPITIPYCLLCTAPMKDLLPKDIASEYEELNNINFSIKESNTMPNGEPMVEPRNIELYEGTKKTKKKSK